MKVQGNIDQFQKVPKFQGYKEALRVKPFWLELLLGVVYKAEAKNLGPFTLLRKTNNMSTILTSEDFFCIFPNQGQEETGNKTSLRAKSNNHNNSFICRKAIFLLLNSIVGKFNFELSVSL